MKWTWFVETWKKWIKECLSTSRVSVLVNGNPTEEFNVGRVFRQGDPLSLFLFLIVAKGRSAMFLQAESL